MEYIPFEMSELVECPIACKHSALSFSENLLDGCSSVAYDMMNRNKKAPSFFDVIICRSDSILAIGMPM
jgi:hypothetical protein